MYPVPPVRNIATLLRSSPSSPHRHCRELQSPQSAASAACVTPAARAPPEDALQSADKSTAAMPEYEYQSNIPTSRGRLCHIRKFLFLRESKPATTSPHCPRQNRVRCAE